MTAYCAAENTYTGKGAGHDLYFLDHPPFRRGGLHPDHLCIADASGQMAAAAHRPLGGRALPCLFRDYMDRLPRLGAPVHGGGNANPPRRVAGGPANSATESPAQSSGRTQRSCTLAAVLVASFII